MAGSLFLVALASLSLAGQEHGRTIPRKTQGRPFIRARPAARSASNRNGRSGCGFPCCLTVSRLAPPIRCVRRAAAPWTVFDLLLTLSEPNQIGGLDGNQNR